MQSRLRLQPYCNPGCSPVTLCCAGLAPRGRVESLRRLPLAHRRRRRAREALRVRVVGEAAVVAAVERHKRPACAKNKLAQPRPAGSPGFCQRPGPTPGSGQPRPISRLGRAVRPYRAWFRRPAGLRGELHAVAAAARWCRPSSAGAGTRARRTQSVQLAAAAHTRHATRPETTERSTEPSTARGYKLSANAQQNQTGRKLPPSV